jgi:hypothetical protein
LVFISRKPSSFNNLEVNISFGVVGGACLFLKHLLFQTTKENSPFVKTNRLILGNRERRVVGPVAWRKEHKEDFWTLSPT